MTPVRLAATTDNLQLEPIAAGLLLPTSVTTDRYGRLYVSQKDGQVYRIENPPEKALFFQVPPNKIKTLAPAWGATELGLDCIAFRNDNSGRFFVSYSVKAGTYGLPDGSGVIEEYQIKEDDTPDTTSARLILGIPRPSSAVYAEYGYQNGTFTHPPLTPGAGSDAGIHNTLTMKLWRAAGETRERLIIATGDAGTYCDRAGLSQNLESPWGKIFQIVPNTTLSDAPYDVPIDNPLSDDPHPVKQLLIAYGLRNPWSICVDELSNTLFIGDVGQGRIEEVDLLSLGTGQLPNFGWPGREGSECLNNTLQPGGYWTPLPKCISSADYVPPIHAYEHGWLSVQSGGIDNGYCITGVLLYRGSRIPTLYGSCLIGDFNSRMAVLKNTPSGWHREELFIRGGAVSAFGEDQDSEPLVLSYSSGTVYRLVSPPPLKTRYWQEYD